eukprot:591015-Prorocentrum_minimum.AAC.1
MFPPQSVARIQENEVTRVPSDDSHSDDTSDNSGAKLNQRITIEHFLAGFPGSNPARTRFSPLS